MRQGGLILAAGRVRSKKKTTKCEILSHPKHTTKQVPRVSLYSPASIDPGFVKIGLVQVSHSVLKTTNATHAQTN